MPDAEGSQQPGSSEPKAREEGGPKVDWQKWNDRDATGKAWAGEGKRLFKKGVVRCQILNDCCVIVDNYFQGHP